MKYNSGAGAGHRKTMWVSQHVTLDKSLNLFGLQDADPKMGGILAEH